MKKSELRKLIKEVISEQLGSAGPRPRVPNKGSLIEHIKNQLYRELGSPKTGSEFEKAYSRWYHMTQPEGPNGEPVGTPQEVSSLIRDKGLEGDIGSPWEPENRAFPLLWWVVLGALALTYQHVGGEYGYDTSTPSWPYF